jgi:hypothetical protein
VGVVGGGQAGADVQELADARFAGQVADRTGQEPTVGTGGLHKARHQLQRHLGCLLVGGEVVLAAEEVVPDAGGVRHAGVDLGRLLAGGGPTVGHWHTFSTEWGR